MGFVETAVHLISLLSRLHSSLYRRVLKAQYGAESIESAIELCVIPCAGCLEIALHLFEHLVGRGERNSVFFTFRPNGGLGKSW